PGVTVSQFAPVLVHEFNSISKFVPVLATDNTCGKGPDPPTGMVKLIGSSWTNTEAPTVTVTGTLTESPPDWNNTCPSKVPAVVPPPGRFEGSMLTVRFAGAVPPEADKLSHPPPSAVLADTVQF